MAFKINPDVLPMSTYVVATGSNQYGSSIKYDNGIMICWRITNPIEVSVTTQWGNLYYGKINDYYRFPAYFIETPFVIYDILPTTSLGAFKLPYSAPTITSEKIDELYVGRATSATTTVRTYIIAIGKWK